MEVLMDIECLDIKGVKNDFLKAIARVKIKDWGIIINDVKLFKKGERYWAAFPTKMYMDNGEKKYFKLVQFEDANKEKEILKTVCDLILKDMQVSKDSYKEFSEEGAIDDFIK